MNSIPKIYRLGERFTQGIFDGEIVIEEKIDGSQFSFCYTDGVLVCRSKSTVITGDPGMFRAAVETATRLATERKLLNDYEYQCEFLAKPKHNVLAYDRVPAGNLVLFDVRRPDGQYLLSNEKTAIAQCFELEPVPIFWSGVLPEFDAARVIACYLQQKSVLGGQLVEGIVIKNYGKQHGERESHPQTAKVVSERFKERHAASPANPKAGPDEFVQRLINSLRTEARWIKALGALRDAGGLTNSTKDIGALIKILQKDLQEEETDWIKQQLFDEFSKQISNGVVQGFAQWYIKIIESGGLNVWQQQKLNEKHSVNPELGVEI